MAPRPPKGTNEPIPGMEPKDVQGKVILTKYGPAVVPDAFFEARENYKFARIPGASLNGPKRSRLFIDALLSQAEELCPPDIDTNNPDPDKPRPWKIVIAEALLRKCATGSAEHINILFDRTAGKISQPAAGAESGSVRTDSYRSQLAIKLGLVANETNIEITSVDEKFQERVTEDQVLEVKSDESQAEVVGDLVQSS